MPLWPLRKMLLRYLVQGIVKLLAILAYEGFFEKLVNGHLQLSAQLAGWFAQGFARLVVYVFVTGYGGNTYWVEMARYGLAEIYFAFFPCLFYGAFHYTFFIIIAIGTYASIDSGRYVTILGVYSVGALLLYMGYIIGVQVGGNSRIYLCQYGSFLLCEGGTAIAIYTATTLAAAKVAHKFFFYNLVAEQYVVYGNHVLHIDVVHQQVVVIYKPFFVGLTAIYLCYRIVVAGK